MKVALILANTERTISIKWASRAAVCSWVSMNSGKTFCHTSIDALKKRRCCHKCCECMGMHGNAHRVDLSHSPDL